MPPVPSRSQDTSGTRLNLFGAPEAVHLVEQLHHRSLDLPVARLVGIEALRAHSVQFIDEYDRRSLLFSQLEGVPDQLGPVTDVHLNQSWSGEFEVAGLGLGGAGSSEESLASSCMSAIGQVD